MKITVQAGIVFSCALLLAACANRPPCASPVGCTQPHPDRWQETWLQQVPVSHKHWTHAVRSGFFAAEPSIGERRLSNTPFDQGLTVLAVRVPSFTDVRINGCFQTQIIGDQDQNSVYIAGTQDAIRQIPVEIQGKSIYIGQTKGNACLADLRRAIVRIGVQRLSRLAIYGSGDIEARNMTSHGMVIIASGNGNTVISGHYAVKGIDLLGNGRLTLIGAHSDDLTIHAPGSGDLSMRGNVGIGCIQHTGGGDIHIMNAWSRNLSLKTAGSGITAIQGNNINLTTVTAQDNSRVYIHGTDSAYIRAKGHQTAEIGLSGHTDTLEASFKDCSHFWGASLHSRVTYVDTQDAAHANVQALGRLFAKATNESSIYYCAATGDVSRFVSGNSMILPRCFENTPWKMPAVWTRAYK